MSEPWQQNGQIPLDIITENCAPRTSVPDHYNGGFENPCTKINDECQGIVNIDLNFGIVLMNWSLLVL